MRDDIRLVCRACGGVARICGRCAVARVVCDECGMEFPAKEYRDDIDAAKDEAWDQCAEHPSEEP